MSRIFTPPLYNHKKYVCYELCNYGIAFVCELYLVGFLPKQQIQSIKNVGIIYWYTVNIKNQQRLPLQTKKEIKCN